MSTRNEERIRKLASQLSYKLEKIVVTIRAGTLRTLNIMVIKSSTSIKYIISSIKIERLKKSGVTSFTKTFFSQGNRKVSVTVVQITSFFRRINISVKIARLKSAMAYLGTAVYRGVSKIATTTKLQATFAAKFVTTRISSVPFSRVNKLSFNWSIPQVNSRSKVKTSRQPALPVQSIVRLPVSEITFPVKPQSNSPPSLAIALNDFSNLPLWLTMPMLFASAFMLGAVVSFLIR
jgi:hypothetical protein